MEVGKVGKKEPQEKGRYSYDGKKKGEEGEAKR